MNSIAVKRASIAGAEEPSFQPPVAPSTLMVGDGVLPATAEKGVLAAHNDARQLVRLVQCPSCSKPFRFPVTLPCGHAVCRGCLPQPRHRTNVSYPNTLAHQLAIPCPTCQQEHSAAECNVDVTFSKVVDLVRGQILDHVQSHPDTPTFLEEVVAEDTTAMLSEEKLVPQILNCGMFHGGRLASTFAMAEQELLSFGSDLKYTVESPTGDEYEELDTALLVRLREVAHKELDCLVCYNLMLDPSTTPCGHTFCRQCLARVMDHSSICPVCRRELHIPASLQDQPSNARIVSLLDSLCPDLVLARQVAFNKEESAGEQAHDTPLFICTLSLPTMPTFLHVFEPRYRLMMRRCLEGNRRFGMVMYNRASVPQGELGATRFLEYGTLLEIVSFQLLRDGRSFVETRGISRFRVLSHGMMDGYNVGRIERIDDVSLGQEMRLEVEEVDAAQIHAEQVNGQNPQILLTGNNFPNMLSTDEIFQECKTYVETMRARSAPWLSARIVSVYGDLPNDPVTFPYWFAAVLPIAEEEKYLLLKTASVRERLKIVYSWIRRIEGQRWPSGSACSIL